MLLCIEGGSLGKKDGGEDGIGEDGGTHRKLYNGKGCGWAKNQHIVVDENNCIIGVTEGEVPFGYGDKTCYLQGDVIGQPISNIHTVKWITQQYENPDVQGGWVCYHEGEIIKTNSSSHS